MSYDKLFFYDSDMTTDALSNTIEQMLHEMVPELAITEILKHSYEIAWLGDSKGYFLTLTVCPRSDEDVLEELESIAKEYADSVRVAEHIRECDGYISFAYETGIKTDYDVELRSLMEMAVGHLAHAFAMYDSDEDAIALLTD